MRNAQSRGLLAGIAGLVLAAWALAGVNPASADSIQVQSYQRSSQDQACTAQPGETPWQSSWGDDASWHPSWEQWANGGAGGWTCTRSITWAKSPMASSGTSVAYALGDVGPGGGLVFLVDNGVYYEMAPNTWGVGESGLEVCDNYRTDVPGARDTAIGTGAGNTAALAASTPCNSTAAAAVLAYAPAGSDRGQWYLPSKDELNAMCNYSRNPTSPADPNTSCYGSSGTTQDPTFATSPYAFAARGYWSSSYYLGFTAWYQNFSDGRQLREDEDSGFPVRPIRAF